MDDLVLEQKMFNEYFRENPEIVKKLNKLNIFTMSELTEKLGNLTLISNNEMEKIIIAVKKYEDMILALAEVTNKVLEIIPQHQYSDMISNIVSLLTKFQEIQETSIKRLTEISGNLVDIWKEPLERLNKVIENIFINLSGNENIDEVLNDYNNNMSNHKWTPLLYEGISSKFIMKVANSHKMEVDLDEIVFSYFDKDYIQNLELKVENSALDDETKIYLREMFYCYKNELYSVCVIANVPIWDRIVYKGKYSLSNSFIKEFNKITPSTVKNKDAIINYAKMNIYYTCKAASQVIPHAPGRHSAVHGFALCHSKKASLSAILFTAFLVSYCI